MTQTLHGQGTLRFTDDEIASMRQDIWEEINSLLVASKAASNNAQRIQVFWLLGGDAPTEADAACFGFIAGALISTAQVHVSSSLFEISSLLQMSQGAEGCQKSARCGRICPSDS
jgi:hypothetical protein